jgi:diaminopimelate epimerase
MILPFHKYHGTGNDFILVDNRGKGFLTRSDEETIRRLCDRRFGIGADGLILLQESPGYDFEMVYFNADGRLSSMCGNGGRCIASFAKRLGIAGQNCRFLAVDGPHEARIIEDDWVELKMSDVAQVERGDGFFYLDTGSPHYVAFVENISQVDVVEQGREIRYSERFREQGVNVNFVQVEDKGIAIATYERGVEDETLSCGTGATACAMAWYLQALPDRHTKVPVRVKGGLLEVRFEPKGEGFTEVWLCGPAVRVFEGKAGVGY